ncbi:MAG TPA: tetratricopeptide repeat protein, partial [Polyangiaceae bacterium]|nr:tetratricopeptide repeat protein [Polyangiaceae bacterium]
MKNLFSPLAKRQRARRANGRGRTLSDQGENAAAIEQYQRAIQLDPSYSAPFYNLGLLHKYRGDWQASLDANLRATELAPKDQAGWWNLGIAATALGRWDLARLAWRGAGLVVPDGEGPLDMPCGFTPIRLHPDGAGETVWSHRLDPARARLSNIPLGDYCYGDVVLNDGAVVGYRKSDGEDVPVFNCLALLEPSALSTWCVEIELDARKATAENESAFNELDSLAQERGLAAEDWSRSVQLLCKACSEGVPHERHDSEPVGSAPATSSEPDSKHRIAIAAHTRGEVNDLLEDWQPA